MAYSEQDPTLEREEIDHMLAHGLDAMVVASSALDPVSLKSMQSAETPFILVDRAFDGFPSHFVGADDYACGKLATEHLLSIGRKHIAHIRGHENSTGKRRLKAYIDTLNRHGLKVRPEYIIEPRSVDVDGKEHGAAALRALLELKRPPDAVFCYSDPTATGVIMEALKRSVRVPEDLAVIGCGNLHSDDIVRVPLSSIDQRSREIGARTAALVLELLAEDATPEVSGRLSCNRVWSLRDSAVVRWHKSYYERCEPEPSVERLCGLEDAWCGLNRVGLTLVV